MTILERLKRRLGDARRRFGVVTLESASGAKMAVLGDDTYAGSTARRYFCGEEVVSRRFLPRVGGIILTAERLSRRYGMALVSNLRVGDEIHERAFQCPWFVELDVPLPESIEIFQRNLPERLMREARLVEKLFTWESTNDEKYLGEFRQKYYLPTIHAAHGSEAFEETVEGMRNNLRRGTFIRLFYEGMWVGGLIGACQNGAFHQYQLGLLNGDYTSVPRLATKALYWAAASFAFERGCHRWELGGVVPDPSEGLFFFKDRWGGRINEKLTHRPPHYFFLDLSQGHCRRFLSEHPMLFWEGDHLSLLTGVVCDEDLAKIESRVRCIGAVQRVYTIRSEYCGGYSPRGGTKGVPKSYRNLVYRVR